MYALPTDGNCRRDYQAVLKQVDSLEEKCGGAEMHDCCTVSIYLHVYYNVMFIIEQVCMNARLQSADFKPNMDKKHSDVIILLTVHNSYTR